MSRKTSIPPQPPQVKTAISFFRYQLIGMTIIAGFFVLALAGLFDSTEEKAKAYSPPLLLEVTYPKRFRYTTTAPFEVRVTNVSAAPHRVKVYVDRNYLSKFSNALFAPVPEKIRDAVYVFDLHELGPRETAVISGEFQAEEYGMFKGFVRAEADGKKLETSLRTISLP